MKQKKTIQLRKQVSAIVGVIVMAASCCGCDADKKIEARVAVSPRTFCNPVNLDYRFMKIEGGEGIREAADPVVVSFKDHYYLFASKSSGYWYSDDFTDWKHVFIPDSVLPIEDYAPAIFVHDEYVYYVKAVPKSFVAQSEKKIKNISSEPAEVPEEEEEEAAPVERIGEESFDFEKQLEESLKDL